VKVLFVTSEALPLMKTGGLGDVGGALPPALAALDCDVRLLLPAYPDAIAAAGKLKTVADILVPPTNLPVRLLEGKLPGTPVPVLLVDFPPAFDRPGNPYHDNQGNSWPDNAARFALFGRVAAMIGLGHAGLRWQPDIVHANDWQAGLAPALLSFDAQRPATIFTIHNLAYQGLFPRETMDQLGLPSSLWSFDGMEFHDQLSFIKGGLVFSDRVTTVSPTYANEIQTPEYGYGLDGLLRYRAQSLHGILNGVDDKIWNPARDEYLIARYSARAMTGKRENKTALQKEFGLEPDSDSLLIGMVGRMVHQKGVDLVAAAIPHLMQQGVQLAILGTGEPLLEQALRDAAKRYPGRCATRVGYDEQQAHRIVGGSDAFLMPSRFEPCGLSQLYSLRYGTVPIVRRVGGLADTVKDGETGVTFDGLDVQSLVDAVARTLSYYRNGPLWRKLRAAGMRQDFSWRHSAKEYIQLYRDVLRGD
jgi:starch synthase